MAAAAQLPALKKTRLPLAPIWLLLALLVLCGGGWAVQPDTWRPRQHGDLAALSVHAYRQWQSTGIRLEPGDEVIIEAEGEWQYSPIVGLNGPQGGRPAVDSYPLPWAPGGALLARIGETAEPVYTGSRQRLIASEPGLLYLRINDDLLGDNQGALSVEIEVRRAALTPYP